MTATMSGLSSVREVNLTVKGRGTRVSRIDELSNGNFTVIFSDGCQREVGEIDAYYISLKYGVRINEIFEA